jgi:hypothetical protein
MGTLGGNESIVIKISSKEHIYTRIPEKENSIISNQ